MTVTVQTAIPFSLFLLEHDYVLTLYKRSCYFAYYLCTFYGRCAYFHSTVGINQEHFVEFDRIAFFCFVAEIVDKQEFTGFCLELLPLNFYDCVHLFIKLYKS